MVQRRRAVPKNWIRNASDQLAIQEGCWFDEAAGKRVCEFVERFCRQSQGRWAGKPIALMDWQRDWIMRLFGWKRADGLRRFRRTYLEIAKKNGKSTLVSALLLYLLVADNEGGPKVFINACNRDQATIVYGEAALMVEASPALAARLNVGRSKHTITCPSNNGSLRANSAEAPSKDGANASAWIFDELHRLGDDRSMYDIFRYAGDARDQPLEINITTAGEDMTGVWYELREYSEKINEGVLPDTTHLGVVYAAAEGDDIDDPKTWEKANPSLGTILSLDDFKRALAEAKQTPEKLANFLRLKLGIVTTTVAKFLDLADWRACSEPIRDLDGRVGYGGFDLFAIRDLTAWCMLFPDADGSFDVVFRCFLPEDNLARRERSDRTSYRQWAKSGDLLLTPGASIDYATVEKRIVEDCRTHNVKSIFADPWNAERSCQDLISKGLKVEYLRQGWSLNAPTKELQRTVIDRRMRHGGNRVATWAASNAVSVMDVHENVMLSKKKSRERIDPLAALVNAFAAYLADATKARNVYESRGVRRL